MALSSALSSKNARWLFCALIGLIVSFLCAGQPTNVMTFWIITTVGISVMAFELLPVMALGIFLPVSYIIFGVGSVKLALAPWLTGIPWIVLAGVLISMVMEKTHLSKRITLHIIATIGTTLPRLMIALAISGYVLGLCIPEAITCLLIMLSIVKAMCEQLGIKPKTMDANVLMVAGFFGAMIPQPMYLPNNMGIVAAEMVRSAGLDFTWLSYLYGNVAPTLLFSVTCIPLLFPFCTKELRELVRGAAPHAHEELAAMGPMSFMEKKALVLVLMGITVFLTESWHQLPVVFLFLFVTSLSFTSLFSLLDESDVKTLPYGVLFFLTGTVSIGLMAGELGIAKQIAASVLPFLEGIHNPVLLAIMSYVSGFIANFILTPLAAVTSLSLPLVEICQELSFPAKPILYSYLYGLEQVLLPYEAAPLLILYSTGYVTLRFFSLIMGLRFIVTGLVIALSAWLLWPMMGIL